MRSPAVLQHTSSDASSAGGEHMSTPQFWCVAGHRCRASSPTFGKEGHGSSFLMLGQYRPSSTLPAPFRLVVGAAGIEATCTLLMRSEDAFEVSFVYASPRLPLRRRLPPPLASCPPTADTTAPPTGPKVRWEDRAPDSRSCHHRAIMAQRHKLCPQFAATCP